MRQPKVKITKEDLKEFILKKSYVKPPNYIGKDFTGLVTIVGMNRDSDLLAKCNYETALEMLGGESKNVIIERSNHWACGWIEVIRVNPKSIKTLKIAYAIHKLLEGYHILDEDTFYQLEMEDRDKQGGENKEYIAKKLCDGLGIENSLDIINLCESLEIYYLEEYGNDSSLLCYEDNAFLEKVCISCKFILDNGLRESTPLFSYLCACFDINEK